MEKIRGLNHFLKYHTNITVVLLVTMFFIKKFLNKNLLRGEVVGFFSQQETENHCWNASAQKARGTVLSSYVYSIGYIRALTN